MFETIRSFIKLPLFFVEQLKIETSPVVML